MTARPVVQVHTPGKEGHTTTPLPAIFTSPLRADVVKDVFTNMAKNKRQPYAVTRAAGHETSAESWGTGRAVARIPRVAGGGTHRAGQAAFGNMCRGGRMFAPTKIWRKWHRKINVNQKRFALASAVSASGVASLVLARGHRIEEIPEVPLVVSNEAIESVTKTKQAVGLLKSLGAYGDVQKVLDSRKIRRGKGKMRNRRYVQRLGPLIIYGKKGPLIAAFRNLPGVELCHVDRLNLLQLAPGGHLGRFVIWTRDAFDRLDGLYGTYDKPSKIKHGYQLPRAKLTNADLNRIINSDEVQSKIRPAVKPARYHTHRKNPLKNLGAMVKLNPYDRVRVKRQLLAQRKLAATPKDKKLAARKAAVKALRKKTKVIKKKRAAYYKALRANPVLHETGKPKEKAKAVVIEGDEDGDD